MPFQSIQPSELTENPFDLIGNQWMLITAGSLDHFNTMTASWGGFGHLWNRDVCFIFVRPQRYTYEFTETCDQFSLTFFDPEHQHILDYCGTTSGRDVDKIKETGLTPRTTANGAVYFDEARLVIECQKLYYQDLTPDTFIDPALDNEIYPLKDHHRMYVGRITSILRRNPK